MKVLPTTTWIFRSKALMAAGIFPARSRMEKPAYVGAGLFEGVPESEIESRARTLVRSIFPVGIKVVGPDVAHPNLIGDLKIVGPDVTHPNFIYWTRTVLHSETSGLRDNGSMDAD